MRIDQLRQMVETWEKAAAAVAQNKSYTIDGVSYTRADAEQVRYMLQYWTQRLSRALGCSRSISVQQGVSRDFGVIYPHRGTHE